METRVVHQPLLLTLIMRRRDFYRHSADFDIDAI
jgi:hypothetical protein